MLFALLLSAPELAVPTSVPEPVPVPVSISQAAPQTERQAPPAGPPRPAQSGITGAPPTAPHLLGDWGGLRPLLERRGITPTMQYIAMPAWNVRGGERERIEYTAQFTIGARFDLARIAGVSGGAVTGLGTNRHGRNLNATAGLGVLQQPQAVFGAGQIWRLSQLFYTQRLGQAELKIGRMSIGEEFGTAPCFFESLYFCGIVPGHISADYWYNPPVCVWGARMKVNDRLGYTQVAVYERNPTNLREDRGFYLGFKGQTGAIVPVERAFRVRLGGDAKREGWYKIGIWHDTSRSNDLILDATGADAAVSGLPRGSARGRWGGYVVARQQVIAARADGSGALNMFASATLTDGRTNLVRSILVAGVTYSGLVPGRAHDEIGFAIGRTRVNPRLTRVQEDRRAQGLGFDDPQYGEIATETSYSVALDPALSVRPNVQAYFNPGGRARRATVVVLGLGVFATL